MLSSLFSPASVYADIDNSIDSSPRRRKETVLDQPEATQDGRLLESGTRAPSERESLPDPFEQEYASDKLLYQPAIGAALNDDGPLAFHTSTNVNPFEMDTLHGQVHSDYIQNEIASDFLPDNRNTREEDNPPKSIMYEERPNIGGVGETELWTQPNDLGNLSTEEQVIGQVDGIQSTHDASPPSNPSFDMRSSISGGPAESSTGLQGSQQVPWWLRESRRHLDAESIKESIPVDTPRIGDQTRYLSSPSPSLPLHTPPLPFKSTLEVFGLQAAIQAASDQVMGGQGPIRLSTSLSAKERALWSWVNVEDLDTFLQDVYTFYVRKGLWSIALSNFLDLLTAGFVISFATFLIGCVDYSTIRNSHSLPEVIVERCVSRSHGLTLALVLVFGAIYALKIVQFGHVLRRLVFMRTFFTELLDIPEADIQSIAWPTVVERLSVLREKYPSHPSASSSHADHSADLGNKTRLDAHDVANRIMRKENYLIALFNKSVLNLAIPVPFALSRSRIFTFLTEKLTLTTTTLDNAANPSVKLPSLTKSLEWNLSFCLLGFLFGPDGQVRHSFVQERSKADLVQALRRRFILMGFLNALFAPFIVIYLLFYSFFRYFEEYHKNPSSIGSRTYTQLARWKFREFNELPHVFQQRLYRSYPLAANYINQFPNDRTAQMARFVAFIAGSFASVLVLFSFVDPEAFLHFEITQDRTVLYYITVFGTILAVSRGMVPDDHRVVDPEQLMKAVIEETHFLPAEWRGKLHSAEVHREFSLLFPLKLASFVQEILSVLTTPLVLWYTLPRCAPAIIDFFREFTIHVDGIGYVCSFAVFDFHRHGDIRFGAPVQGKNELISSQGKLEKSVLNFKTANPNWQPHDQATSLYLSRMTDAASTMLTRPLRRSGSRTSRHLGHPSPRASPILEDEDDTDPSVLSGSVLGDRGRRQLQLFPGLAKGPVVDGRRLATEHFTGPIAEESGLGDSYVSTMETTRPHKSPNHPRNHGMSGSSPGADFAEARPSMIGLFVEGTKPRW